MVWALPAATTGALLIGLVLAPAASAANGGSIVPLAIFGIELPSLHSIIEGIAKGFFGALAHALVPSWLTHGTVATIQHLVALPDPATWTHVGQLQADMVWLGASLLPVTLAIGTVRYWLVGLTGSAHPAGMNGSSGISSTASTIGRRRSAQTGRLCQEKHASIRSRMARRVLWALRLEREANRQ